MSEIDFSNTADRFAARKNPAEAGFLFKMARPGRFELPTF